jgi:lysozyme
MRIAVLSPLFATLVALGLTGCGSSPDTSAPGPTAQANAPGVVARRVPIAYPSFQDHDAHDWDGRTPGHYPVHGIDVSRWQGDIDWPTARDAGIAFAFIKATEGGDHIDPMFVANWEGARKAGVHHGAYHFFFLCRPAHEQARWFIENVPKDRTALPPVLDMEWNHASRTCRARPDPAFLRAEAEVFLNILERHYGKRPIIYTTVDFYHETGIGALENTQFWLRSVAGHPGQVYPGEAWAFWQYTGTGVVPGIKGPVDINAFAGSVNQWRTWAN